MTGISAQLNLTVTQKLAMTPQLQQALQILQMSTVELAETVSDVLAANPLIEAESEGFDPAAPEAETPAPVVAETPFDRPVGVESNFERSEALITWSQTARRHENDDEPAEAGELVAGSESLASHLERQLGCCSADDEVKQCALWLIGSLDENGFLADTLDECAADAPFDVDPALWRTALNLLQTFDPAGVAARDVTESLLLQLRAREGVKDDVRQAARAMLADSARYLAKLTPQQTARDLQTTTDIVAEAQSLIAQLTPRPAADFADMTQSAAVIPDVILYRTEEGLKVRLNPQVVPALRFNQTYFELLTSAKLAGDEMTAWKNRAQNAKSFIHALEQRFSTIVSVAQTIVDAQPTFFTEGVSALRPMVLRDVAMRLGVAESTVSRATAGKFMQTDRGTFELKYFFTNAVTGAAGGSVSAAAARTKLREIVDAEDPDNPLSDDAIAKALSDAGIEVARRTVAKYRELENIAPRPMRRRMKAMRR